MTSSINHRARNAIALAFVGDALAMPVHWFYDPKDIVAAFGENGVVKFEAPPPKHPYTFMKVPVADETSGKRIVGDVIHKQTWRHWGPENAHVHVSLKAGEITLNAEVAHLVTVRQFARTGHHNVGDYVESYIKLLTADPQIVKDTYAEGFHRNFFTAVAQGKPASEAADVSEGAESIGGLVSVVPAVILELVRDRNVDRVKHLARDHVKRTHNRDNLLVVVDAYVELVAKLLFRESDDIVGPAISAAYQSATKKDDFLDLVNVAAGNVIGISGQPYKSSCDVSGSWPAILLLAMKYASSPSDGIRANANIGGENVHRGFVLASLLGLTSDQGADAAFAEYAVGLADPTILADIDAAIAKV